MYNHHHQSTIHIVGASSWKEHCNGKDPFLQALIACLPPKVKKHLEQAGATGAWLTTIPDHFSGTELTKTEWLDIIALQYGYGSPHLPSCCNGCSEGFTVKHALNCKKGGLIGICHDDTHNELAHLNSLTFSNVHVMIKPTNASKETQATVPFPRRSPNATLGDKSQGDVLMHGVWLSCPRIQPFLCEKEEVFIY
ncbi:hypothetical protein ACHAW6_005603 [Cyclotella cf. meneghiniana]